MSKDGRHQSVKSRNESFTKKTKTKIWKEIPDTDNPYMAKRALCHGYDFFSLVEKKSFVEMFFLLFRGDLPSQPESELLETLMKLLINPGPRHPATRAAMNSGVGKTRVAHMLPIAASVLGGDYLGGGKIEESMRFFRKYHRKNTSALIEDVFQKGTTFSEWEEALPGFGRIQGDADGMTKRMANILLSCDGGSVALAWGEVLAQELRKFRVDWTKAGIAAAVFSDLGFHPRYGVSLFQWMAMPGALAHGLEIANKPITAMPYVKDEDYVIDRT